MKDKIPTPKIVPHNTTPFDKKIAEEFQKVIDYEYAQINASKIIKTPWGTIIWSPKND